MTHEAFDAPDNNPGHPQQSDGKEDTRVERSAGLPSRDFEWASSKISDCVIDKNWPVVSHLARLHSEYRHQEDMAISKDEATRLCLFAIVHDAPSSTIDTLKDLLVNATQESGDAAVSVPLKGILLAPFVGEVRRNTWSTFNKALSFLEQHRDTIPQQTLDSLLNVRINRKQLHFAPNSYQVPEEDSQINNFPSLLHVAYLSDRGSNNWSVSRLLALGANPTATFDYAKTGFKTVIRGCTLLHVVAVERDNAGYERFPERESALQIANEHGNTPLHEFVNTIKVDSSEGLRQDATWLRRLTRDADQHTPQDKEVKSLSDELLERGRFKLFAHMQDELPEPRCLDTSKTYAIVPIEAGVRYDAITLLNSTVKILSNMSPELQLEAGSLLQRGESLYDLYLYAEAVVELTTSFELQGEGLVRLMPRLLWHYPPDQCKALVRAYEAYHDHLMYDLKQLPDSHPGEAEMLLFLNHPGFDSLRPENTNFLTSGITSVARFIDQSVALDDYTTLENWRRIGAISHSFLRYKYDSRPASGADLPALLEEFGFQKIPERPTDRGDFDKNIPALGPGFRLNGRVLDGLDRVYQSTSGETVTEFSVHTQLEFRHAYYLACNPHAGLLIIRNSSLVFGRSALKHPAYWMPPEETAGLSHDDLLHLSVNFIEKEMKHVVDADLYEEHISRATSDSIAYLLDQLKIVQSEYRNWRFNSDFDSAFEIKKGRTRLSDRGAWNAPGFREIVKRLRHWQEEPAARPLALAFAHPYLPPWQTHTFIDENGAAQNKLLVTDERLAILEQLADGRARRGDLIDSGLQSFFQVAGINTHGELLIVDA